MSMMALNLVRGLGYLLSRCLLAKNHSWEPGHTYSLRQAVIPQCYKPEGHDCQSPTDAPIQLEQSGRLHDQL